MALQAGNVDLVPKDVIVSTCLSAHLSTLCHELSGRTPFDEDSPLRLSLQWLLDRFWRFCFGRPFGFKERKKPKQIVNQMTNNITDEKLIYNRNGGQDYYQFVMSEKYLEDKKSPSMFRWFSRWLSTPFSNNDDNPLAMMSDFKSPGILTNRPIGDLFSCDDILQGYATEIPQGRKRKYLEEENDGDTSSKKMAKISQGRKRNGAVTKQTVNIRNHHEHKNHKGPEMRVSLETSSYITQKGGVLEIPDTDVKLEIPSNAFSEDYDGCNVTVRIVNDTSSKIPMEAFEDCITSVEILSEGLKLNKAATLTLPHCLQIRNPRSCKVKVFLGNCDEGKKYNWQAARGIITPNACIVSLFGGGLVICQILKSHYEKIEKKKVILFAKQMKNLVSRYLTVKVGYYPNLPGGDELFMKNENGWENCQTCYENFDFHAASQDPLSFELVEIVPNYWKANDKGPKVTSHDDVLRGNNQNHAFHLKSDKPKPDLLPRCDFTVSQGRRQARLCLVMREPTEKQGSPPKEDFALNSSHRSMDDAVKDEVLTKLSRKVGNGWKHIGRCLNLEETDLDDISSNHYRDQAEMSHQIFVTWKRKNGRNATYRMLQDALTEASRADLVHALKALKGATRTKGAKFNVSSCFNFF